MKPDNAGQLKEIPDERSDKGNSEFPTSKHVDKLGGAMRKFMKDTDYHKGSLNSTKEQAMKNYQQSVLLGVAKYLSLDTG